MTDILLSSFLSLFALFGKKEQVDEAWAKTMLVNYLRHQFGIRNIDSYIGFYSDLKSTYDLMDDDSLDTQAIVRSICSALHGKIKASEKSLLLLRLMEFCGYREGHGEDLFRAMVETLEIPEEQFRNFADFVESRETCQSD